MPFATQPLSVTMELNCAAHQKVGDTDGPIQSPSTESMSRRPLSFQNHEPPPAEQMPIPILAAEEAVLLLGPLCTAAEAGID
ncbi:hypothetical protein OC842_008011, partial [Tilletia horrida]